MARGDPQRIVKTAAGPSEILVALDGSELSRAALQAAIRLGRMFRTRIHVLHVVPKLEEYAGQTELLEPLLRKLSSVGEAIVEDAAKAVEAAGLRANTAGGAGGPAPGATGSREK